jgi:hypothetical protein
LKIKLNSHITQEDLIKALRDLADSLEANFSNCYLPPGRGWVVPGSKEEQALLCSMYENPARVYQTVNRNPGGALDKLIEKTGLKYQYEEMLQNHWPELYEKVLEGQMSASEAIHRVCRNDKKIQHAIQAQEPEDPDTDIPF